MAKFNLFKSITAQIGKNVQNQTREEVIVSLVNKNEAIVILNNLVKNGCLKIASIKNKGSEFIVTYKDLNLDTPQLRGLLKYDQSLTQLEYNNKVRFEEQQNYSTPFLTEMDGAYLGDGSKYEHLLPEDSAFSEWVVQDRGWSSMNEFMNALGLYWREELDKYLKDFYAEQIAPEYEYEAIEE